AGAGPGGGRAWERRQLRGMGEREARRWDEPAAAGAGVEGESFARPFTRRSRAASPAPDRGAPALVTEGGTSRRGETPGSQEVGSPWGEEWGAGGRPLSAAAAANGAAG